jgi:hypothetical protein
VGGETKMIREKGKMRKVKLLMVIFSFLIGLFGFLSLSSKALAEEQKEEEEEWRKNLVLFNPLSLIFGLFDAEYHRGVLKGLAVGGRLTYLFGGYRALTSNLYHLTSGRLTYLFGGAGITGGGWVSLSALGIGPSVGIFFTGKAPEGLNLLAQPTILFVSASSDEESASATGFGFPILLAYNWIFGKKGVGFGLSVGVGITILSISVSVGKESGSVSRVGSALKFALGIGF